MKFRNEAKCCTIVNDEGKKPNNQVKCAFCKCFLAQKGGDLFNLFQLLKNCFFAPSVIYGIHNCQS